MKSKFIFIFLLSVILTIVFLEVDDWTIASLPELLIFTILVGIFEKYPIVLPNGIKISASTLLILVALFHYGTPEVIKVAVLLSIIMAISKRLSVSNWVIHASPIILTILIIGTIFEYFNTISPSDRIFDLWLYMTISVLYSMIFHHLQVIIQTFVMGGKFSSLWYSKLYETIHNCLYTTIAGIPLIAIFKSDINFSFWLSMVYVLILYVLLRYAFSLFLNLRNTYLTSLESLTQIVEQKINTSNGHSTRVGRLARKIAEELKLAREEIDSIHYAALLHDIGKIQIENGIFHKRGPLTLEEERQFRKHPEIGAKIIEEISGFTKAIEYILYHHEQWDGKGYPEGKIGSEIPLGARIIAVADEYDQILHYRRSEDPRQAIEMLSGTKLDPSLLAVLYKVADFKRTYKEGEEVKYEAVEEKVIEAIYTKFKESKILKDFGAGQFFYYTAGNFLDSNDEPIRIPCESKVKELLKDELQSNVTKHEFIEDSSTHRIYNLHWTKVSNRILLLMFDVSNLLEFEKKQEHQIKKIYRDVIHSVTQNKLLLIEKEELQLYYKGEVLIENGILVKENVSVCRKLVDLLLEDLSISGKQRYNILLSVSEAVTNVLKHASSGNMTAIKDGSVLRIIVQDNGDGIPLSDIPKSALLSGYSTKLSLGHGFGIMVKMMDRVSLQTGSDGTTIILDTELKEC